MLTANRDSFYSPNKRACSRTVTEANLSSLIIYIIFTRYCKNEDHSTLHSTVNFYKLCSSLFSLSTTIHTQSLSRVLCGTASCFSLPPTPCHPPAHLCNTIETQHFNTHKHTQVRERKVTELAALTLTSQLCTSMQCSFLSPTRPRYTVSIFFFIFLFLVSTVCCSLRECNCRQVWDEINESFNQ